MIIATKEKTILDTICFFARSSAKNTACNKRSRGTAYAPLANNPKSTEETPLPKEPVPPKIRHTAIKTATPARIIGTAFCIPDGEAVFLFLSFELDIYIPP